MQKEKKNEGKQKLSYKYFLKALNVRASKHINWKVYFIKQCEIVAKEGSCWLVLAESIYYHDNPDFISHLRIPILKSKKTVVSPNVTRRLCDERYTKKKQAW